jgi:hypothetical protein
MHKRPRNQRRCRPQRGQEGNVLLIVLLILMMATSTATFVLHGTAQDQRAAGAMRNAMRARYVAESAAMTAVVLAEETPAGLPMNVGTWLDWMGTRAASPNRRRYGMPSYGTVDPLIGIDPHSYLLQSSKFTPMCTDQGDQQDVQVNASGDSVDSNGMFALVPRFDGTSPRAAAGAARLTPPFSSLVEVWPIHREGRASFRYVITGIGELVEPGIVPTDGDRSEQDVVSLSRAYYDVR